MNDEQLDRCLRSIGMACFVNYYQLFADMSLSNGAAAAMLSVRERYAQKATHTRVSQARRIIRAGRAEDAFRLIAQANRVDAGVGERARLLAMACSKNPGPRS